MTSTVVGLAAALVRFPWHDWDDPQMTWTDDGVFRLLRRAVQDGLQQLLEPVPRAGKTLSDIDTWLEQAGGSLFSALLDQANLTAEQFGVDPDDTSAGAKMVRIMVARVLTAWHDSGAVTMIWTALPGDPVTICYNRLMNH